MVSDEHKRRVLTHQERETLRADAHRERPMVIFIHQETLTDAHVQKEDGGQAVVIEMDMTDGEMETGLFVRIQSWDPSKTHGDIRKLFGRKVEVTIRTIDN